MKRFHCFLTIPLLMFLSSGFAFAQTHRISVTLTDAMTSEPVSFATIYLEKEGSSSKYVYALTDAEGKGHLDKVKNGTYTFIAELMGYVRYEQEVTVKDGNLDLGTVKMKQDVEMLDKAVVSAAGNPIVVKKDTIEYNAQMFKTTDSDMLVELLKKLPGVEVASDGTITANGKTINKITIDGKTFFLDDPQIASKNIPAKIVEKVKVLEKKSEQAEFTGIDDGEEETVIDLNIKKGMMKGWFGTVTGGGGHDLPKASEVNPNPSYDARWQASTMIGRFTDKSQLSFIGNGNNTNNRGLQDMAGEMMNSMRSSNGGGARMGGNGGNMFGNSSGITTSWMGGVNGNWTLLDDNNLDLGANYLYNGSDKYLTEESNKVSFTDSVSRLRAFNYGESKTFSQGHRGGAEFDWDITKKTSILFRPQFNVGQGRFDESTNYVTNSFKTTGTDTTRVNEGGSNATGDSKSWKTNGRLLFKQKIGEAKGRTLSLNVDYSLSNNRLDGLNKSTTYSNFERLSDIWVARDSSIVDQNYNQKQDAYSVSGNLTYTEPLGKNFFLQASYKYSWNRNTSQKMTYQNVTQLLDTTYSNRFLNDFNRHDIRLVLVKQESKYNVQAGLTVQPATTRSHRYGFDDSGAEKTTLDTSYTVWNFSPTVRFDYTFSDVESIRLNYRGTTNQPTITQLSPVPDNSNPVNVSLGNGTLNPSFSHRLWMDYRKTNMETFASVGLMSNFTYTKDAIVSANWYNKNGIQYSAPVNAKGSSWQGNVMLMANTPFARDSKFSFQSFTRLGLNSALSYTGNDSTATSIEEILGNMTGYRTTSLSANENFSFIFRNDYLEARLGGKVGYKQAWYAQQTQKNTTTWDNAVTGEITGTLPWKMELKTDAEYDFYFGYSSGYGDPKFIWNAEIAQVFYKDKFTLRFKVYDLLNQSLNNYRTTTDNYVQDVMNNTLGRYFMLSLTFRFGNFGEAAKNMRRPSGGPGGGPAGGGPGQGGPPRM